MSTGFDKPESEIIEAVQRGSTDSYTVLVRHYQRYIYSITFKSLGDQSLAEELTQEIFVRAFFAIRSFRGESTFKTWLTRITLNAIRSRIRAMRREPLVPFLFDSKRHAAISPFEAMTAEERERGLYASIGSLKPKFRTVVELCSLEGRSYQEAAEMLGIPVGTVCSRMNTAFKILRRRLAKL